MNTFIFSKNALKWIKGDSKMFLFKLKAVLLILIFIYYDFHKHIKQQKLFSTLIIKGTITIIIPLLLLIPIIIGWAPNQNDF